MIEDTVNPAADGKQLTFTPNWMANVGVKYTEGPWSGMVSMRYVSKVYSSETNSDAATGLPTFYDPYVLLDAKVSYKFDNGLVLSVTGKNLGDVHYYEYYLQQGRTVLASLGYKF